MIPIISRGGLGFARSSRNAPGFEQSWELSTKSGSGTVTDSDQLVAFDGTDLGAGSVAAIRSKAALTGKVYCEFELVSQSSNNNYHCFGVAKTSYTAGITNPNQWHMFSRHPNASGGCGLNVSGYYTSGSGTSSSSYNHQVGDRIGIAVDVDAGKIWYRINGTWVAGDPGAGTGETHSFTPGGSFYFQFLNYTCNAAGVTLSARIYPAASQQSGALPSGFSAYGG